MQDKTRTAQTLARGLQVLDAFRDRQKDIPPETPAPAELGITDLVHTLHLSATVVSRLVTTLVEHGYLYQNTATKKYVLGMAAYTLGLAAVPQVQLRNTAYPHLQRLAQHTAETVSLNVVDRQSLEGVCIASIDSPAQIKLTTRVGNVRPLHRGASRKVLLAYLESWQQEQYIVRLELCTMQADALRQELKEIHLRGYAYSEAELDVGAFAVAAPILSCEGHLLGSVAVAGPVFRKTSALMEMWVDALNQTVTDIQRELSPLCDGHA
ncbi:IclR family transcriptional regulator [Alicyclobacillaceae bacterium I2511]|nr:IclR family transcriptional regulator [Alicyclobacillaceae bacterium I2511]